MATRTFTGRTFAEALSKVKRELGEDAVILKSERRSSSGSFGIGAKDIYEVIAASSDELKADLESGTEFAHELDVQLKDEKPARAPASQNYEIALLRTEVAALRDQLGELMKYFRYNNLPAMPEALSISFERMTEAGLGRELAADLSNEALVSLGPDSLQSVEEITSFVISKVSQIAPPATNRIVARSNRPYKIALVGAPGAGKTSTLQKLATDPLGYGKHKIGLLTLDTHRMAAVEQLKTFARVSGLALEVAYQPKDVPTALTKLQGAQVILVDSAGCAPGEEQRMNELVELLGSVSPDETHLVLNSTMRLQEQIAITKRFQQVGVTHLTMTRLDESTQPGMLVNISQSARKPIAWLTSGQKFIGQIERYHPEWLRAKVFNAGFAAREFETLSRNNATA
ncbi:hypothetical protein HUU59_00280 [bacterium]|nr:hypothetical protein [bacterium]